MRANNCRRNAFTLIELVVAVMIVGILLLMGAMIVFGLTVVIPGNCWFTHDGLLRELKADHPEAREVLRTETHIVAPSVIVVLNEDGSKTMYQLDSDILFNYGLKKVEKREQTAR